MAKQVIDQWLLDKDGNPDPFAGTVDFGMTHQDEIDPNLLDDRPTPALNPEVIGNQPPAPSDEPVIEEQPPAPAPEPEPEGPETIDLGDGATVVRTKEKGQWKAVLDPGTGANPEVFWGKTKDELLANTLKGKLEATKKIRELNKKVKTARLAPSLSPAPTPQTVTSPRQLTADEAFEIKALWESDPAAAINKLTQLQTGLTLGEIVAKSQKGEQAAFNLDSEAVAKEFLSRNPDYYSDPNNRNFFLLTKWIGEKTLRKVVDETNSEQIFHELCATGNFTVANLEAAFEDLSEDDELVKHPKRPKPSPPVEETQPVPQPAPATPQSRIVKTETRPRAALGLRPSDVSATPPPASSTAPTDEDLNNLSDEQISALLRGVRRERVAARRSN